MFKIKKIITGIMLLFLMISPAMAEKVDVMLYYTPGGLYDRMHKNIVIPVLGDNFGKYVVVDGCVEAANYLNSTNRPTVGLWGLGNQVPLENGNQNPCSADIQNIAGILSVLDFRLCSLRKNEEYDLDYFLNEKVTVGAHGHPIWFMYMSDLVSALNPNARTIPYRRSGEYLPALAAGEVDYLFANRVQEDSSCHLTTRDISYDGMVSANTITDNIWSEVSIYTMMAFNNMTSEQAFNLLQEIQTSKEYNEWTEKFLIHLPPISGQSLDVERSFIQSHVKKISDNLE